ncbi:CDP-alcohol phosphatidyltransferase [Brevibacterium sp. 239c]|uniref:CDP-alcohol phosphatidyltransferase family protein n=1 Tax=Brevibacterium sp. 239c TaxID=1965356 RepID=UPI000C67BCE5|nr:CDP-alcohol phosphatidyltransferase family protein [Brevibacterium sp. 239c]SMX68032.1 CDP-alcohol phosphatidyltransferase [Brevibacterium sp. 239c]
MRSSHSSGTSPGLRLLSPLAMLSAATLISAALHPQWSTILIVLTLFGLGAGRSLLRAETWRPADDVTTVRLGLIMVFTALVIRDDGFSWTAIVVGGLALILDACDGYVARRTGATSAGADFDESVDALVVLVLSVALVPIWGWWVVLPGTFYYLFRGAALLRPAWRQQQLPPSALRKTIAASQGILLLTAGSPVALANPSLGIMSAVIALAALVFSFGRDIVWLERHAGTLTPGTTHRHAEYSVRLQPASQKAEAVSGNAEDSERLPVRRLGP